MCGICNVVNCVKKALCGCNRRSSCSSTYSYNGCDSCNYNYNNGCSNSRYSEPRTRVTCANQRLGNYEPCCDDECNSHCHCHNHCHDDDC